MKELIDIKFKILWYIKFLEFMEMWEEIEYKELLYNKCYFCIHRNKIYIRDNELNSEDSKYNRKLSDFILNYKHISNKIDLNELTEFSKYLEETYSFLPKWKELNEYLYKLAVIKWA